MAEFPSPSELVAASALLELSATTPASITQSVFNFAFKDEESIGEASKIRSCRASLVYSECKSSESSEQSDASTKAIFDFVPANRELKLKVVRRSRSKTQQVFGGWKLGSGESSAMRSSGSVTAAESSSCMTMATNSSADSSARSRDAVARAREKLWSINGGGDVARRSKAHIGSAHIRRRADGILSMLSGGSFSEVTIRQVLGDSPDTSKALRILLKLEKVKRSGAGGRQSPYIYMIA